MRLRVTVHQKVALGISFLVCGCAIYLLFRSNTLNPEKHNFQKKRLFLYQNALSASKIDGAFSI
jgi:hypothetical protein